ncbi:hypothetical protein [[Eubacterium] cellulosolvens]
MIGPTKKLSVIIITFLLMILVAFSVGMSMGDPGAPSFRGDANLMGYFLELDDYGVDENNDTSYDKLILSMKLNISEAADYLILADMSHAGVQAGDRVSESFDIGVYDLEFEFDGVSIYESARDGPYNISITIYKGVGVEPVVTNFYYETSNYNYETFNPTPAPGPSEKASIEVINNTIQLKTEIFTAVIYELTPMIEFYYSTDEGKQARFKVTYQRVICFNDQNSDGKFEEGELQYYADLAISNWNSKKVLMENFNSFDFKVHAIVNLLNSMNRQIDTKLELVFHYSSSIKLEDHAAAQKFDLNIKVRGSPLTEVTHIALEHELTDETINHEFMEYIAEDETKISFITYDGKEHGYFSWMNSFDIKSGSVGDKTEEVKYNLEPGTEPAVKKLYLNYPYTPDTAEIFHDPVVGVNPANQPPPVGNPSEKIINHQIIIYFIVAVIAAVIMLGNIYRQRKRK